MSGHLHLTNTGQIKRYTSEEAAFTGHTPKCCSNVRPQRWLGKGLRKVTEVYRNVHITRPILKPLHTKWLSWRTWMADVQPKKGIPLWKINTRQWNDSAHFLDGEETWQSTAGGVRRGKDGLAEQEGPRREPPLLSFAGTKPIPAEALCVSREVLSMERSTRRWAPRTGIQLGSGRPCCGGQLPSSRLHHRAQQSTPARSSRGQWHILSYFSEYNLSCFDKQWL